MCLDHLEWFTVQLRSSILCGILALFTRPLSNYLLKVFSGLIAQESSRSCKSLLSRMYKACGANFEGGRRTWTSRTLDIKSQGPHEVTSL